MSVDSATSTNKGVARRPVARRACLSCREKKIKCDGEALSKEENKETTNGDEREADEGAKPRVCSNCKMLGTECVFVQSMRGGRRKKRSVGSDESPKSSKTSRLQSEASESAAPSTWNDSMGKFGSFSFGSGKLGPRPPSPTLSYSSTLYADPVDKLKNRGSVESGMDSYSNNSYAPEEYSRHYPGFSNAQMMYRGSYYGQYPPPPPPPHPHPHPHPPHHHGPPPPHPHMMDYPHSPSSKDEELKSHVPQSGPPSPGPPGYHNFPHHMYRGPPTHMHEPPGGPWGLYPPPPPPPPPHYRHHHRHPKHHYHRYRHHHPHPHPYHYRLPPPPPPHLLPPPPSQLAPPHYMGYNPSLPLPQGYGGSEYFGSNKSKSPSTGTSDAVSESSKKNNQTAAEKPVLPPLAGGSEPGTSDYLNGYARYSKGDSEMKSEIGRKDKDLNSSLSSTGKNDTISETGYPPFEMRGVQKEHFYRYGQSVLVYSNEELLNYELPEVDTLNACIDSYYANNHINDQIFSSKEIFLKRLSLTSDGAVLHALIATVCHDVKLKINSDEDYWVSKVFKYWDDLNDLGMLVSYGLISTVPSIKHNFKKNIDINMRMWNIINSNNYIGMLKNKTRDMLNARQAYEREILNRLVWKYWISHILTLRFKQGFPYYKLSTIDPDFKMSYEIDQYANNCPLPLSNEDHLKLSGRRLEWNEFNSIDFSKASLSDSNSVIYSMILFESIMNKIANKELDALVEFDSSFIDRVSSQYMIKGMADNYVGINTGFLLSTFVIHTANCLQASYFLDKAIVFNVFSHPPEKSTKDFTPLVNDFSSNNLLNLEELPKVIDQLTDSQWNCVFTLVYSAFEIVALIEQESLHPGSKLIFGVTNSVNGKHWTERTELAVSKKDSWLMYSDFSLTSYCMLLPIFTSLVILTHYIAFEVHGDAVEITFPKVKKTRRVPVAGRRAYTPSLKNFTSDQLLNKISIMTSFVKVKIEQNEEALVNDTLTKINKLSHYLEEILNSIK